MLRGKIGGELLIVSLERLDSPIPVNNIFFWKVFVCKIALSCIDMASNGKIDVLLYGLGA